jgi:hypothetical protein
MAGQKMVNGSDCTIVIKTTHKETDIPYSEETIREAISLLEEQPPIEGDGISRAIRKAGGVTGCVVTPFMIGTAPLLLCLAMGAAELPVYVSESRNLYRYRIELLPNEDCESFDLIQDRGGERWFFQGCRVQGFELRFLRGENVKLKLDIAGKNVPTVYPYNDTFERSQGERFYSDWVSYKINNQEYKNIYGLTLSVKKEGGTRTELWIKRALQKETDIPAAIEEMSITARLLRDNYEKNRFGLFRITLKNLVMVSDETSVNCADTVIAPLRYYVSGCIFTEVFTSGDGGIL